MCLFEKRRMVVYNFLTQRAFTCSAACLSFLAQLEEWVEGLSFVERATKFGLTNGKDISKLVRLGAIVVEATKVASEDEHYEREWAWGAMAGFFHFGSRFGDYVPTSVGDAILRERAKITQSPPLYQTNDQFDPVVPLDIPQNKQGIFDALRMRRSNRILIDRPISLESLSDLLFYSLSITHVVQNPGICDLPLKMTPSGGARNPYEAFICARNINGLARGNYHYSAFEHSLGFVSRPMPEFPSLTGNQSWTRNAAAIVFLVAYFERAMWKYRDPGAYKIAVIEAGHIAQNIMILATYHGMVANPTCALTEDRIQKLFGIHRVTHSIVYALVLGHSKPGFEWQYQLPE